MNDDTPGAASRAKDSPAAESLGPWGLRAAAKIALSTSRTSLSEVDETFLSLARAAAIKSNDPSTKTGAVIVPKDAQRVYYGWNRFPRQMPDHPSFYADRDEKLSRIIHCEMVALINGPNPAELAGATLYTWPFLSCERCAVHMLEAGIVRFVAPAPTDDQESRWGLAWQKARRYITECGAIYEEVEFT